MKILSLIISFLLSINICSAELIRSHIHREWKFPVENGTIIFLLSAVNSTIDNQPIYTLQIISRKVNPSVLTEAKFLKSVIQDMEKEEMLPQRIVGIILELREADVSRQLSIAAYSSKIWIKAKKNYREKAVVQLLNSIGAYSSFNQILSQYGMVVKVYHADHLTLIRPEQIGLKGDVVSVLPSNATLELGVYLKNSK